MNRNIWITLLVCGLCSSTAMAADYQHSYATPQSSTVLANSANTTGSDKTYTLRQGDVLRIDVEEERELGNNRTFTVRPDGDVSFPMVGTIKAEGLTVDEFSEALSRALGRYIINPHVSANVETLGGVRVYVFGEINRPGAYTLTKSSTVIDAIGAAGSFNWDTAKKKIFLIHQNDPSKPIEINLNTMLKTGDMSQNYVMREGDILYLTKNSRISFSRDIAPILTGAYMVSRIGKD